MTVSHTGTKSILGDRMALLLLLLILAAGAAIRLQGIGEPLIEFHPMRQYFVANKARGIYAHWDTNMNPARRDALITIADQGEYVLEPTIYETIVAATYMVTGDRLWVGRVYSVLFFTLGGVFLYLLGSRMFDREVALIALAVYMLVPFGVTASRTYQPDSLMLMTMLAGLLLIWRYHESPSWAGVVAAGVVSGLALLVKPLGIYFLTLSFLALEYHRQGSIRKMINARSVVFALLMALPVLLYYLPRIFTPGSELEANATAQFVPGLLLDRLYWAGWYQQIDKAVGPLLLVLGLLGIGLMTQQRNRLLMTGLWVSYVLFGITFTYLVSTHSYYQLQLIPIVALSVSPLLAGLMNQLLRIFKLPLTRSLFAALSVVMLAILSLKEVRFRQSIYGYYDGLDPRVVDSAAEIAEIVGPADRVVSLSEGYSRPLWYHGEMLTQHWPSLIDFWAEAWREGRQVSEADYEALVRARFGALDADYFVITDMVEFSYQDVLHELLQDYAIVAQTDDYLIYDLREE